MASREPILILEFFFTGRKVVVGLPKLSNFTLKSFKFILEILKFVKSRIIDHISEIFLAAAIEEMALANKVRQHSAVFQRSTIPGGLPTVFRTSDSVFRRRLYQPRSRVSLCPPHRPSRRYGP